MMIDHFDPSKHVQELDALLADCAAARPKIKWSKVLWLLNSHGIAAVGGKLEPSNTWIQVEHDLTCASGVYTTSIFGMKFGGPTATESLDKAWRCVFEAAKVLRP